MLVPQFESDEEKLEYIQKVSNMAKILAKSSNELEQLMSESPDLDSVVNKSLEVVYATFTANHYFGILGDEYHKGQESLTYAQESAVMNCLREVSTKIRIGEYYEAVKGGWYNITEASIRDGSALESEFIKALRELDLDQNKLKQEQIVSEQSHGKK